MGYGAYYADEDGNRFSGPDQLTVYCAEDPLVAITEGAFYQALKWQNEIASFKMKAVTYPLHSEHLCWAFHINPLPVLIDAESASASLHFRYPPHLLLNPSRKYSGTQAIANGIRTYVPPAGSGEPRPEGLKSASVRTPYVGVFQPHQVALFVRDTPWSPPFSNRAQLAAKMKIEYEFLTHDVATSVAYQTTRINWARPRFRLSTLPPEPFLDPIPVYAGRPNSVVYTLNNWHEIEVVF